jgi:putative ABC transport system ATP-binding protein
MVPLLHADNITKIYTGDNVATNALAGISLAIEKGEFVSIEGPSGSGKSTLLHILGFLDQPTGGTYRFENKIATDYTDTERAHVRNTAMGFVFQSFNLLPRTSVYDNVTLPLLYARIPKSAWRKRAEAVIESVGLKNRTSHTPSELSGGEKQRAAIARALVNDPQVIFADEPTGNLDSESGASVMQLLKTLNKKDKRTIILITHEKNAAEYAKRHIILADGKIIQDLKD